MLLNKKVGKKKKRFLKLKIEPKNTSSTRPVLLQPIQEKNENSISHPTPFEVEPNIISPVKAPKGTKGNLVPEEFKRLDRLGDGNNGEVFKVLHERTSQYYALKIFRVVDNSEKMIDSEGKMENMSIRAIEMELKLLQQMNSPRIIKMIDYKIDRFFVFMLLEYMDCGSLDKILKITGPFPTRIISLITKQILEGLEHLHSEKEIIHRDLTLANLLVNIGSETDPCEIKISDFGMANKKRENGKTVFHSFVGKMSHMSPSRAMGEAHTFISDIWSLGMCLLELYAGKYPLKIKERNNYFEMIECLEKLVQGENMFISVEWDDPDFEDFCQKCLQVDDKKRENAKKLLQHKFITKYEGEKEEDAGALRKWFSEKLKK